MLRWMADGLGWMADKFAGLTIDEQGIVMIGFFAGIPLLFGVLVMALDHVPSPDERRKPRQGAHDKPVTENRQDTARLEWLIRRLPGDLSRKLVGVLDNTGDLDEWRKKIDQARGVEDEA